MLMGPRLTKNLLTLANIHVTATGGAMSSLSKKAHSDSAFFDRLAAGKISFSVRKYDEIIVWFYRHWPDGAAWPAGIDLPTVREARKIARIEEVP